MTEHYLNPRNPGRRYLPHGSVPVRIDPSGVLSEMIRERTSPPPSTRR